MSDGLRNLQFHACGYPSLCCLQYMKYISRRCCASRARQFDSRPSKSVWHSSTAVDSRCLQDLATKLTSTHAQTLGVPSSKRAPQRKQVHGKEEPKCGRTGG